MATKMSDDQEAATLQAVQQGLERVAAHLGKQAFEQRVSDEVERRLAAAAALPKRSQMSAKAKSDFIFAHGPEAYEALPWD
jgi:hypothetical protein